MDDVVTTPDASVSIPSPVPGGGSTQKGRALALRVLGVVAEAPHVFVEATARPVFDAATTNRALSFAERVTFPLSV